MVANAFEKKKLRLQFILFILTKWFLSVFVAELTTIALTC